MERITRAQLDAAVHMLNHMTGNNPEPYREDGGKWVANLGNYHINGAYGGVALHQMCNEGGGIRDIFSSGHMTKRELFDRIHAYRYGIQAGAAK